MVLVLASIDKNNLNASRHYSGDRVPTPQVIALSSKIGSRIQNLPPPSPLFRLFFLSSS